MQNLTKQRELMKGKKTNEEVKVFAPCYLLNTMALVELLAYQRHLDLMFGPNGALFFENKPLFAMSELI